jgi:hypothetical protein
MLGFEHDNKLSCFDWETAEPKTRLPKSFGAFFESNGPMPVHPESRRSYQRYYLRSNATLRMRDKVLGVYTTDASRKGIRFLAPMQLLPKERGRIRLPNTKAFQIEIVRCRRVDDCCYECGANFVLGVG